MCLANITSTFNNSRRSTCVNIVIREPESIIVVNGCLNIWLFITNGWLSLPPRCKTISSSSCSLLSSDWLSSHSIRLIFCIPAFPGNCLFRRHYHFWGVCTFLHNDLLLHSFCIFHSLPCRLPVGFVETLGRNLCTVFFLSVTAYMGSFLISRLPVSSVCC